MKIVVLDGLTLNPGDLDWEGFKSLGDIKVYDRTKEEDILERAEGAEVLLTNKTPLLEETIEKLPALKYVGVLATGYNVVDVEACKKRGIVVTNIPGYGTYSVAQHTIALLLELTNRVSLYNKSVQEKEWIHSEDFTYLKAPVSELYGKTMGIIGMGTIGTQVKLIAESLGMKVVTLKRKNREGLSFKELLRESDVVSLHCPLTKETEGLLDYEAFKEMKETGILINTSRGPLVVEEDLVRAIKEGEIFGAGLDVISQEPMREDSPLVGVKNLILTPHVAWASREARQRLMDMAVENLEAFLEGKERNRV